MNDAQTLPKLTRKQEAFVRELVNEPKQSGTGAVLKVYGKPGKTMANGTARQMASENLTKPSILAHLYNAAEKAELNMVEFMSQRKDVRLAFDASRDVLDRVHGKATQRVESTSTTVTISIDMSGATQHNDDDVNPT